MQVLSVRSLAACAAIVLGLAIVPTSKACEIAFCPQPLALISYDIMDPFWYTYIYTQGGSGTQTVRSTGVSCIQLGGEFASSWPLALSGITAPAQYADIWISTYSWQDGRPSGLSGGGPAPFYPFPAGGTLYVQGIDVTSGAYVDGFGFQDLVVLPLY